MVTPFSGGEVDYDTFREQIEFQIAAGTNCLVPRGHDRRVADAQRTTSTSA